MHHGDGIDDQEESCGGKEGENEWRRDQMDIFFFDHTMYHTEHYSRLVKYLLAGALLSKPKYELAPPLEMFVGVIFLALNFLGMYGASVD